MKQGLPTILTICDRKISISKFLMFDKLYDSNQIWNEYSETHIRFVNKISINFVLFISQGKKRMIYITFYFKHGKTKGV
jgi:hypothetical protein